MLFNSTYSTVKYAVQIWYTSNNFTVLLTLEILNVSTYFVFLPS